MHTLADFLNHGTLPFIGREGEIGRIVGFWRGTFDATELRAMLLTGEAGIGKSRLLEQAIRRILDAGGSVVHVKLYPESTTSFMALVARALWHRDAGRSCLGEEPEPKLAPVGGAMQRLARLRPLLFVLEDLHLLGGEALPELVRLLGVIADESISLLCLARPVDLAARGGLEPYLVDELALRGLAPDECARVWSDVMGSAIDPGLAEVLHDATAGNPLALRSALRGALRSANIDPVTPLRPPSNLAGAASLGRALRRAVGLLADGMTAHLGAEELRGARRLALLGEVFAREAALLMTGDAGSLIEALLFKGIIATAVAPPDALPGEASAHPLLGFTHTLLHRQLIESADTDAGELVRVIADGPLYSILPFRLLAERRWDAGSLDTGIIGGAFDRTFRVQIAIRRSAQWRGTEQIWEVAMRLVASRLGRWEQSEWERMIVKLVNHKLDLVRREPREVRERWLAYLSALTEGASSDEMIKGRLVVLFHHELLHSPGSPAVTRELWEEAEALVAGRPHLRPTFVYADYVVAACVGARSNGDTAMMRRIESCADALLASDDLPAPIRMTFERKVRPPLLMLYDNQKELRARLAQVTAFESSVEKSDVSVWKFCTDLLAETAMAGELRRICESTIPMMREQGLIAPLVDTVSRRGSVLAGAADALEPSLLALDEALAELPGWRRAGLRSLRALPLVDAALLRGEPVRAREVIGRYDIADEGLGLARRILLALDAPDPRATLAAASSLHDGGELAPLPDLHLAGDHPPIVELLDAPILRLTDLLRVHAVVASIEIASLTGAGGPPAGALAEAVADALVRAFDWLAEPGRGLFSYMRPLLECGRPYLSSRRLATWQKKIDELAGDHGRMQMVGGEERLRLSMLGTITARMPDGRQQRFQGGRARMLLAMMVINQMLDEPFSSAEFCRLAAGGQAIDIENARDVVKATVHRIREMIGRDAILTDGATPRLNPELVDVDLLETHVLLKRAVEAMRRSSPMRAKGALIAAMDISRGEVPFPSLYDDMIEAMREDFENEMRTTAIDVAAALSREGGADDAAEVLRRSCAAIPGDESLAELLRDALMQAGRRAEATRARMKAEIE